jgi:hypothetical protein
MSLDSFIDVLSRIRMAPEQEEAFAEALVDQESVKDDNPIIKQDFL